jgi:hypothetical protein
MRVDETGLRIDEFRVQGAAHWNPLPLSAGAPLTSAAMPFRHSDWTGELAW